jgi:hypothetical protein
VVADVSAGNLDGDGIHDSRHAIEYVVEYVENAHFCWHQRREGAKKRLLGGRSPYEPISPATNEIVILSHNFTADQCS